MTGPDDHDDIGKSVEKALTVLRALRKHNANDYEKKLLYQRLELIPWLAPKIRYALNEEIDALADGEVVIELNPGLPPKLIGRPRYTTRAKNDEENQIRAMFAYSQIEERKEFMRRTGERPQGGIHVEAYKVQAKALGMTVEALKKLIQRHAPKGERRQKLKKAMQRSARSKASGLD